MCNLFPRAKRTTGALVLIALAVAVVFMLDRNPNLLAQEESEPIREIRTLYPGEKNIHNISGLAYDRQFDYFYLVGRQDETTDLLIATFSPYEDLVATNSLPGGEEDGLALAVDSQRQQLITWDHKRDELYQIRLNDSGTLLPTAAQRVPLNQLQNAEVLGLALAPDGKSLYLLDSRTQRVRVLTADAAGNFMGTRSRTISLGTSDREYLRSLTVHPVTGNLFLIGLRTMQLLEVSPTGNIRHRYDLRDLNLIDPRGLVFAPSADRTDTPETLHLFIADRGNAVDHKGARIIEIALGAPDSVRSAAAPEERSLYLVKTNVLSLQTPPSPDPSGITFITPSQHLFYSDGEVNEMPLFAGANLFELDSTHTLTHAANTLAFSDEPTGVEYNPNNGHLFITDDDKKKIFEVDAGADGQWGTTDDVVTNFKTSTFESFDPEGIGFDATAGEIYIVDGINNEVYRINPGTNGLFDGIVADGGDDLISNFDLFGLGILDPEGIYYHPQRGTLFIVARADDVVYEVSTTGVLLTHWIIADVDAERLAGITRAPGSLNSAVMNYYISDRGIDNDADPSENDGKIYEFTTIPTFGNVFISPRDNGEIDGVDYRDEDILSYDTTEDKWSLFFDGSDVDVTTDVDAFTQLDDGTLLFSYEIDTNVPGLGLVGDSDIVRFIPESLGGTTSGTFEWYFDGSDVDLTTASEDIDSISVVSGTLILSMLGDPLVGSLFARDEDLLTFTPTQLGENTAGSWALYFDGSDVGLDTTNREDVQGSHVDPATGAIYLSTRGEFAVDGVTGDGASIFICTPVSLGETTACTFSPFLDGATLGFTTETIDGFRIAPTVSAAASGTRSAIPGDPLVPGNPRTVAQDEPVYMQYLPLLQVQGE